MGILRADRITGLGGANAIKGSVFYKGKSFIKVEPDSSFTLGTGDYTVEAWVYSEKSYGGIFQLFDSNVMDGSNDSGPGFGAVISDGEWNTYYGSGSIADSGVDLETSVWQHVALVRYSGTTKIYINGTSIVSQSDSTNYTSSMIYPVIGGWWNNDYNWQGYMSNFRFVVGTAVYQSNFTPPTSELTAIDGTQILCFQTSDILREETGKTLVIDGESNNNAPIASRFTPNSPVGFSTTTDVGSQYGTTFDGFGSFSTSTYMVPPGGNTRERNRGRAVFGGGQSTSYTSAIQIFNIQSQGNTIEVGELSQSNWGLGACGSSTRGLFGGGRTAPGGSGNYLNTIEFVTIANAGNSSDFGDLTRANSYINALGNQTRGIWAGGYNVDTKPATNIGSNTIDYVTIATAGNAADFGDMVRQDGSSDTTFSKFSTANSTRGLIAGGYNSGGEQDEITYITIATTGNSTYFGDLTAVSAFGGSGASSSTRGILTVGGTPGPHNRIDFVTIATTGNATDFGDLTLARRYSQGVSNKTRAVFITGYTGSDTNLIDFVTIATTGNATDFGDNDREDNYGNGATSDSHGGLS